MTVERGFQENKEPSVRRVDIPKICHFEQSEKSAFPFFPFSFPHFSLPRFTQIIPNRVHRFNQRNLFLSPPLLDFLLAFDGNAHIGSGFKENQTVDVLRLRKPIDQFVLVLVKTTLQIVSHADIKSSRFAG